MAANNNYTSDSEFDIVKRVQITNEVPVESLWHHLPAGLKTEFWNYFLGTVNINREMPIISATDRPLKIVNGTVAPIYGPAAPETPNPVDPETFHSLEIDGVVMPEIDFFLHELYRYLEALYPDHPDYSQLLTPLEINDAMRSAAALIGYTPDYKFLETWSKSITGIAMSREELKWKIRDLRSVAFRRKFYGSYQGYKLIFSSIMRHGSVYIAGSYHPRDSHGLDYTDERTFRKFRLIDFTGENDTVFKQNASIEFRGIVDPSDLSRAYEYDHKDIFDLSTVSQFPLISLGTFLYQNEDSLSSITIQTTGKDISPASTSYEIYYVNTSAPLVATCRGYEVKRGDDTHREEIRLVPHPLINGAFSFPLGTAMDVYPGSVSVSNMSSAALEDTLAISDEIHDEYIEEIITYKDSAVITDIERGKAHVTLDPENSPVMEDFPAQGDPQYGLEFETRIYSKDEAGNPYVQVEKLFIQGSLSFSTDTSAHPTDAYFELAAIPENHPITGDSNRANFFDVEGNRTVSIGATTTFLENTPEGWKYMGGLVGWLDSIDWGHLVTRSTMARNTANAPIPFSVERFGDWKERAAQSYRTGISASDETTIFGTIDSDLPDQVSVNSAIESVKLNYLSAGDPVRGPGIQTGTVVASVTPDYFTLSSPALRSGSSEFIVSLRSARTTQDVDLFDFKTQVYSLYPDTLTGVSSFLWPSPTWPYTSKGYLEGLKDASLYALPPNLTEASPIQFEKDIFLEVSLDRVLYHQNTRGFQMGSAYASLMDIAWLEFIEAFASRSKRATDNVRIGSQLSLSTDTSGLYSIIPEHDYTDPNIKSKFITIPYNYDVDSVPAYLQVGSGGHSGDKDKLFVSVSDLLRPPIYGAVTHDSNRDLSDDPINVEIKKRGVYSTAQSKNASADVSDNVVSLVDLEQPLFEIPVREYEYFNNFATEDLPGNRYQVIQASIYHEEFDDIPLDASLVVNSPYIMQGEQLPRDLWTFKGRWNPTPSSGDQYYPDYPKPEDHSERDYYLVSTTTYIGTYEFNQGDWIIFDGTNWNRRQWLMLGEWPPSDEDVQSVYLSPSKVQLQEYLAPLGLDIKEALNEYFVYFIASADLTLLGIAEDAEDPGSTVDIPVSKHDWVILTKETYIDDQVNNLTVITGEDEDGDGEPDHYFLATTDGALGTRPISYSEYQPWLVAGGRTYEIVRQSFDKSILSTSSFTTIARQRGELIEETLQTQILPRRYASRGSCNFELKIDPEYKAKDTNGAEYNFTEDAIRWDNEKFQFYVNNTGQDGSVTRHFIDFQEPAYFKNLLPIIGTVNAEDPNTLHAYTDIDFPVEELSLTDQAKSGLQVYIRNDYDESKENEYYSHYVDVIGEIDVDDPTTIRPVVNSPLIETRREEFRIAMQGIAVGDTIRASIPSVIRSYEQRFENKYFKNLLVLTAKVDREDPSILRAIGESDDEVRAFSDAMSILNAGDYIEQLYTPDGTLYKFSDPVFSDGAGSVELRTISFGAGVWLAAGTNEKIAISESGPSSGWTEYSLPSTWGGGTVLASVFSYSEETWFVAGTNGNLAASFDGGHTWEDFAGPNNWDAYDILSLAASADYPAAEGENPKQLMMTAQAGKVAYFEENSGTREWIESTLPTTIQGIQDGMVAADPITGAPTGTPTAETVGWEAQNVNAAAYGGQDIWMIVGNGGKAAKITSGDLTLTPDNDNPTYWEMIALPADIAGEDNVESEGGPSSGLGNIMNVHFADGTWVVIGELNGAGKIAYSHDDGDTWAMAGIVDDLLTGDPPILYGLTWKAGEWIITGASGVILNSTDGKLWKVKEIPGVPNITLRDATTGDQSLAIVGDSPNVFTSSSKAEATESISIAGLITDAGTLAIELDDDLIPETVWNNKTEFEVLISFYTLSSVDNSLIGIPANKISTYTNPATRQLYVSDKMAIDTFELANRVYLPRTNDYLISPTLSNNDPNPDYIGANGFPLYEEDPEQYYLDEDGDPSEFTNTFGAEISYCDEDGNYIDNDYETIAADQFTQITETEEDGATTEFIDIRSTAFLPKFISYEEWLESGNDIQEGEDPIEIASATVVEIHNEQNEEPCLKLSISIPELIPPFNAITLGVLPANPEPIPLEGVPHYRTDGSGNNQGLVAVIDGDNVYYSMEPMENNTVMLETRSNTNAGVVAEEDEEQNAIYSLEPVKYFENAFLLEEGQVSASTRDGKVYYTLDNDTLTGMYFPPDGYGSWADRPNTDSKMPWENDPNAFHGQDLDEDGFNDSFYYLQNKRQDPIHLVDEMGRLVLDDNGDPIEVPAPRYFSYSDLIANDGNVIEKEAFSIAEGTTITAVSADGSSFSLSNPIQMEEGLTSQQVRLNLLTIASVESTALNHDDPRLIHEMTVQDLARYEPDRVCYDDSAYPSFDADEELYEAGYFTNRNGQPIYLADTTGQYVNEVEGTIGINLALRVAPRQPRFYLCQDWFEAEYFVPGDESNPYWQYLIVEDYLDIRSKEWKQRVKIYQKVKGEFGKEMVFREVGDADAYVTLYPGLEYSRDASSMIVRETDYINYRDGKVTCIMVANNKYDINLHPNLDEEVAQYGINLRSTWHEKLDRENHPVNIFNTDQVVQSTIKGKWRLNYSVNTTKNFADSADNKSSIVSVTELGVFNAQGDMIAYANFPPVIYDSARHHFSLNLFIKEGEFAPT